jgi:hypothetical protein
MSIKVTPNADGSYTVSCEGVDVVVGQGADSGPTKGSGDKSRPDTGPDPGPIIWPDDPDENDGGVYAYLFVGKPTSRPGLFRSTARRPSQLPLESPYALARLVQDELKFPRARRASHQRCMCVMLAAAPEQPLELDAILEYLRPIAESEGLRIELHIAVGAVVGISSG